MCLSPKKEQIKNFVAMLTRCVVHFSHSLWNIFLDISESWYQEACTLPQERRFIFCLERARQPDAGVF